MELLNNFIYDMFLIISIMAVAAVCVVVAYKIAGYFNEGG